jgi:hypothetical protein
MTVQEAKEKHSKEFMRSVSEGDGWPCEADNDLNDACRSLVAAIAAEHGEAWLGLINLYGEKRHGASPYIWKWDGSTVLNFSCAFVLPRHDVELERLIRERDDAEYTGTSADAVRVDAIFKRLEEAGGHHLFWT